MSNDGRIGLTPVPSDADLVTFLQTTIESDQGALRAYLGELQATITDNTANGNPVEFTYGSLMNFLVSLSEPVRIHLLAAAMWELRETDTDAT